MTLLDTSPVIGDVLKDMIAQDEVEGVVVEGNVSDVNVRVHFAAALDVSSHIVGVMLPLSEERPLG